VKYRADPRVRELLKLAHLVPSQFKNVLQTLTEMAEEAATEWRAWASGGKKLPNGERIFARSGEYAKSIKIRRADQGSEIAMEVYSDSKIHEYLEDGRKERDMKQMLQTSPKVRRAKAGHRYLIIPFRHDVSKGHETGGGGPSGEHRVPPSVTAHFRNSERTGTPASRVIRTIHERSQQTGLGHIMVTRHQYQWGARFHADKVGTDPITRQPIHLGQRSKENSQGRYTWKAGAMSGLVHFAGFKGRHGSYMTFRVMSERSPASSWIAPARPPMRILDQLRGHMERANFTDRLTTAAIADFQAIISGAR
jgi:hypothetical protein